MLLLLSICIPESVTSTPIFRGAVNCLKAHEYLEMIPFIQFLFAWKYEKYMGTDSFIVRKIRMAQ